LTWTVVIVAVWLGAACGSSARGARVTADGLRRAALRGAVRSPGGGTRALAILLFRRGAFLRLTAERREIREEILDLGREVEAAARS